MTPKRAASLATCPHKFSARGTRGRPCRYGGYSGTLGSCLTWILPRQSGTTRLAQHLESPPIRSKFVNERPKSDKTPKFRCTPAVETCRYRSILNWLEVKKLDVWVPAGRRDHCPRTAMWARLGNPHRRGLETPNPLVGSWPLSAAARVRRPPNTGHPGQSRDVTGEVEIGN
jgi:hypothetical protein